MHLSADGTVGDLEPRIFNPEGRRWSPNGTQTRWHRTPQRDRHWASWHPPSQRFSPSTETTSTGRKVVTLRDRYPQPRSERHWGGGDDPDGTDIPTPAPPSPNLPSSLSSESYTLHWICPVLCMAHDIHSPS